MDKYEIMTELMKTFDELETLKRENHDLMCVLESDLDIAIGQADKGEGDEFRTLDYYALKAGRKALIEEYFYTWNSINVGRDEHGKIVATSFDSWLKRAFNRCPDYSSKNLFIKYLDSDLKAMYEDKKQDAIDSFIESEQEDQETEE